MKTLELITKIEADETWYIIRLTIDGKKDSKFFLDKELANKKFEDAITNFEVLGKETVIRTASFNDEIRTVYVSSDSGEAYLKLPDYGAWYDIKTDATIELVEHAMAEAKGDIDKCIEGLVDRKFFCERVKMK